MEKGESLYQVVVAANIELQKLLAHIVSIFSLQHSHSTSSDPEIALSQVLANHCVQIKNSIKPCYYTKILEGEESDVVLPQIKINSLDSELLLDLLLKVKEFLKLPIITGSCIQRHRYKCCLKCSHESATCEQYLRTDRSSTDVAHHDCQNCLRTIKQCVDYNQICCYDCNVCLHCNELFYDRQLGYVEESKLSPQPKPCQWYAFLHSLEIALKFRTLFGIVTVEHCQEFLNNKKLLKNSDKMSNYAQLYKNIRTLFASILAHMADEKFFKKPIMKEESKVYMDNLELIFTHDNSLKGYLRSYWLQFRKVFTGVSTEYIGKLNQCENHLSNDDKPIATFTRNPAVLLEIQKDKTLLLIVTLQRDQLPWYSQSLQSHKVFTCADIDQNSHLLKSLKQCIIDIFKESCKSPESFQIIQVECTFKKVLMPTKKANVSFKMILVQNKNKQFQSMLPEILSLNNFKQSMNLHMFRKYGLRTDIICHGWAFESVMIKGNVTKIKDVFTKQEEYFILQELQEQATILFKGTDISIQNIPTQKTDQTKIELQLKLSVGDEAMISEIKEFVPEFDDLILQRIKPALKENGKLFTLHVCTIFF